MAQRALTKNALDIAPFWQKTSAEPPTEWEKWNQQLYLGTVAKDELNLQKLLRDPSTVRKPQEPGYEIPIEGETQSQTRDRNIRNQEKKIQWDNQCTQLDNLVPTVDGIPWDKTDVNVRSYLYLSIGTKVEDVSFNITHEKKCMKKHKKHRQEHFGTDWNTSSSKTATKRLTDTRRS